MLRCDVTLEITHTVSSSDKTSVVFHDTDAAQLGSDDVSFACPLGNQLISFINSFIFSKSEPPSPQHHHPHRPVFPPAHLTVGLSEALHLVGTRRANGPWLNSSGFSAPPPRRPAMGAEEERSEEERSRRQGSSSSFGCVVSGWIVAYQRE